MARPRGQGVAIATGGAVLGGGGPRPRWRRGAVLGGAVLGPRRGGLGLIGGLIGGLLEGPRWPCKGLGGLLATTTPATSFGRFQPIAGISAEQSKNPRPG